MWITQNREIRNDNDDIIAVISLWRRQDGPHLLLIEYEDSKYMVDCVILKWMSERGLEFKNHENQTLWMQRLIPNDMLVEIRMRWL